MGLEMVPTLPINQIIAQISRLCSKENKRRGIFTMWPGYFPGEPELTGAFWLKQTHQSG
jgi:hypothetical protein